MRKSLAFVLIAYLATFWSPFIVLADEYSSNAERCYFTGADCDGVTKQELDAVEANNPEGTGTTAGDAEELKNAIMAPMMCPFGVMGGEGVEYGTYTSNQKSQVYEAFYASESEKMQKEFTTNKDQNTCGEPNNYSKYLEKGDCSADGLIVTEITEVIAPNTELDGKNKIITTYAGLCCFAGEVKDGGVVTCDDTRTIYTTSYSECSKVAINCEKRQWVIGDSGIGVVKLMIKQIYVFGAISVGSIAVSTMIFQGIKISVSGVSGDISDSKNKILQALSGIVLLFVSGLILYTINPGFFG